MKTITYSTLSVVFIVFLTLAIVTAVIPDERATVEPEPSGVGAHISDGAAYHEEAQ